MWALGVREEVKFYHSKVETRNQKFSLKSVTWMQGFLTSLLDGRSLLDGWSLLDGRSLLAGWSLLDGWSLTDGGSLTDGWSLLDGQKILGGRYCPRLALGHLGVHSC